MKEFKVSRINTKLGIFRLAGKRLSSSEKVNVEYSSAEFMSTDGWCELDLASEHTRDILSRIQSEVLEHLSLIQHESS